MKVNKCAKDKHHSHNTDRHVTSMHMSVSGFISCDNDCSPLKSISTQGSSSNTPRTELNAVQTLRTWGRWKRVSRSEVWPFAAATSWWSLCLRAVCAGNVWDEMWLSRTRPPQQQLAETQINLKKNFVLMTSLDSLMLNFSGLCRVCWSAVVQWWSGLFKCPLHLSNESLISVGGFTWSLIIPNRVKMPQINTWESKGWDPLWGWCNQNWRRKHVNVTTWLLTDLLILSGRKREGNQTSAEGSCLIHTHYQDNDWATYLSFQMKRRENEWPSWIYRQES